MRRPLARACALAILAILPACSGTPAEGRWIGTTTPEPGSAPAPGCRGPAHATLTVRGKEATFIPDETSIVLTGEATPDGRIRASRTTTGADKKPYVLVFEAQTTGSAIIGTYAAPRCRAKVVLKPL